MKKIVLVLGLCIFFLTGCAGEEKEIKTTVEEFLSLYCATDGSAANYLFNYEYNSEIQFEGLQKLLAQRLDYKIGKVEADTNNKELSYVNVIVKNVSFEDAYELVLQSFEADITEAEILKLFENVFESENASMAEFEIRVPVCKVDDQYKIVMNGQVSNALMGGLNEYMVTLTGGVQDE